MLRVNVPSRPFIFGGKLTAQDVLKYAYGRGYRVVDGVAVSFSGRILCLTLDKWGYYKFSLSTPVGVRSIHVHRLVAFQKYGMDMFADGIQVRHKDGDSKNNKEDNILIGTLSQNCMDKRPEIRLRTSRYAARKLSDEQVKQLRSDRSCGFKYVDLMIKYGVCKSTVSYIVNRRTCNTV